MKIKIKKQIPDSVRNLLLYTDEPQAISINDKMIDWLLSGTVTLSLWVAYGKSLKVVLDRLNTEALSFDKAQKAIFVLRSSKSYEMKVSELSDLTRYINEHFSKDVNVGWGLASSRSEEHPMTVIVAVSH